MSDRIRQLRWILLVIAAVVLVAFLVAQKQTANVTYGQSPSSRDGVGETAVVPDLPPISDIAAMLDKDPVVRLPGAIAYWDENLVRDAIGDDDTRILVAPPGVSEDQNKQLNDIEDADILVVGTSVTGDIAGVSSDDLPSWRGEYATGDVTSLLLTIIAFERDQPLPADIDLLERRPPTDAELAPVVADLAAGRPHIGPGSTLASIPASASDAFPDSAVLVAAFGRQKFGEPLADYGPALAQRFPDRPIVVMYGAWIEYHGPHADEFAEVSAASFYAQFRSLLSKQDYPQQNLLNVYLNRVVDIRYAGIFDRPLPYEPFDPLRVALPALPWIFGACVLAFLVLSFRPIVGSAAKAHSAPARVATLNALAIEMSGLSHDASLVRGIQRLQTASNALDKNLGWSFVNRLIGEAESELDAAARKLGREDLRPQNYVTGAFL